MIQFKAFKAVLPNADCFSEVPVLNPNLFPIENRTNNSYLNIMEQDAKTAKSCYQNFLKKGILQAENSEGFYIYEQENKDRKFKGIIGLCSIEDFLNGKILPHEKTIAKREKQFFRHLKLNPIQAEPVCLISESDLLSDLIHESSKAIPLASFEKNGATHRFWKIAPSELIANIFKQSDHLFIADGHHRLASVAMYHKKIDSNYHDLLSFVIPKKDIGIFPYHREILLSEAEQNKVKQYLIEFEFESMQTLPSLVGENHVVLALNGALYQKKIQTSGLVLNEINESLFEKTLGFESNKNIKFIPGEKSISDLWKKNTKNVLQVFLPKVSFEQIKGFSQNHQFFPPKSTWILPKIPTGLCICEM